MTIAPNTAMATSANLKVDDLKVLERSADTIANAANGVDERISLLIVDLAAKPPNVDVDDVGRRIEVQIPDVLQQHGARHDLAFTAHQVLEKLELSRQQFDIAVPPPGGARHQIELEVADPKHRLLHQGGAASRQRLDARHQLREGKWLDEIIVAAGAQAADPVIDLAERADDQDRRGDSFVAQILHDGEPVDVGKHAIDRHYDIIGGGYAAQRLVTVAGDVDLITVRRQRMGKLTGCFSIVFDDEDATLPACHGLTSPGVRLLRTGGRHAGMP